MTRLNVCGEEKNSENYLFLVVHLERESVRKETKVRDNHIGETGSKTLRRACTVVLQYTMLTYI